MSAGSWPGLSLGPAAPSPNCDGLGHVAWMPIPRISDQGACGDVLGEDFDQVLIAARGGAEWAWSLIYGDLSTSVIGYLRARGAFEPEDVAAEVFLQVVRDLHSFDGHESDFRPWVFSIAHHRLLDDARYRSRRPVEAASAEVLAEVAPVADPQDEALTAVTVSKVKALIQRLPEDQQNVLLLRLLGQMTVTEVAQALRKRPGAVKALQRRALAALDRMISREGVTL